jgi:histidinol-phosphate aminotransferase
VEVLNRQAANLRAARADLMAALARMPDVEVFPSAANFILIRVPNSDDAHAKLLSRKVLVKNVSKMHGVLTNCLRITVSTPEENSNFLDAFAASLAA